MSVHNFSKKAPVRVNYLRSAIITLISVVLTWIMTGLAFWIDPVPPAVAEEILVATWVIATLVPTFVSFPVAVILQRERLKLAHALMQLEDVHAELARSARTDALTLLLNREAFLSDVEQLKEKGVRGSMLMIDVDHFKTINDTWGHAAGDEALKLVSEAIRSAVRKQDVVGRLGGEEFGVFVNDDNPVTGRDIAERVCLSISGIKFFPRSGIARRITASVGLATSNLARDTDQMMGYADRSLYEAKNSGRNQVKVYEAA
ncbi:GGDEF domain-containing protein [Henriciella marina]|uniref:GGDEF domain-containing protein n=1 Tax=Henriciella marina TaxID=453851 RepID=UPI000372DC20|nr:GGDEF domain-containing protein [Henriciella marina]